MNELLETTDRIEDERAVLAVGVGVADRDCVGHEACELLELGDRVGGVALQQPRDLHERRVTDVSGVVQNVERPSRW